MDRRDIWRELERARAPAHGAPASGPTVTDAPERRSLRRYTEAQVDELVGLYERGLSAAKIADALGLPKSTVFYHLRRRGIERRPPALPWKHPAPSPRPCATCGNEFTPTGYSVAQGWGRFCSRACARAAERVADPEPRACRYKHCGRVFTPWPSEAVRPGHGQFCSHRCRQLHFWRDDREKLEPFPPLGR